MKKIKFGLVIVFATGGFTLTSKFVDNKGDINLMSIINNAHASRESSSGWERCEVNS